LPHFIFGQEVLLPITVAVLLSFVLSPLVNLLRERGAKQKEIGINRSKTALRDGRAGKGATPRPKNLSAARDRAPPVLAGPLYGLENKFARLACERNELLEQQAAISEVLGVISRSKFELRPILQSVVDTAARLCRAEAASIFRLDRGVYRWAVGIPAYREIEQQTPIFPAPGTVVGREASSRNVARIDDAWMDPFYEKKATPRLVQFAR
jgi:hypothetical protein